MGVERHRLKRRVAGCASSTRCSAIAARASLVSYPRDRRDAGARHLRGGDGSRPQARHQVMPEIMVPLVAAKAELDLVKDAHRQRGRAVEKEQGVT